MSHALTNEILNWTEILLLIGTLGAMFARRCVRDFTCVAWYLGARACYDLVALCILSRYASHHFEKHLLWHAYFWNYAICLGLFVALGLGIIYQLYRLAMAPLPGLQRLGIIMFKWAAGISFALSFAMVFGPRISSVDFLARLLGLLQQSESVLTLCMLLFVAITASPMGLSVRSKIFGVCLGFGVNATAQLVSSAWFNHLPQLNNVASVINGVAVCLSLCIWAVYFAMPDPKRRMIVLPTTSPFLRWNQISAVLGDAPGYVALGVVTQDMFDPAEVEIMRRAAAKMTAVAYGD